MDHRLAKETVERIENAVPVDQLSYKETNVWPLLKFHLYFRLLQNGKDKESEPGRDGLQKNYKVVRGMYSLLKMPVTFLKAYFVFRKQLGEFQRQSEGKSVLFIDVPSKLYVDQVEGKLYSRYLSPYIDAVGSSASVMLLNPYEDTASGNKHFQPYLFSLSFFRTYDAIIQWLKSGFKSRQSVRGFELFKQEARDTAAEGLISESEVIANADEVMVHERFWKSVLSEKKWKAVFLECYYGNNSHYGLLAAAHRLNIPTVEVQHGLAILPMYTGWCKSPKSGFEYLPDLIWCWSSYEKEKIARSRKGAKVLTPVLGGNPWLQKSMLSLDRNDANRALETRINSAKPGRVVLVTLQHSIPLSETLIRAILMSPPDWLWLVRFHPHDWRDPGYRSAYKQRFANLPQVEYELATASNLHALLACSDIHCTHFSTVANEAVNFRLRTILLDRSFERIFSDYIQDRVFIPAENAGHLIELVKASGKLEEPFFNKYAGITGDKREVLLATRIIQ